MIIIKHRINSLDDLDLVPLEYGVECDIRYHENELILQHDPFNHHKQLNVRFVDLLAQWKHSGPLILNVKTEGVEKSCISLMGEYKIRNWFFLDLSMPFFVKYAQIASSGSEPGFTPDNLAVRYSEFEPIEYAISFANKARWVWVDCFSHLPLDLNSYALLKAHNFKICLVSPELQKHDLSRIAEFKKLTSNLEIDAVCTKRPDLWSRV